nr:MAG TPA: hypothetical protein [Caudoviricetes sp.]
MCGGDPTRSIVNPLEIGIPNGNLNITVGVKKLRLFCLLNQKEEPNG